MDTKICPKCQAKWLDGQHYWATGKPGNEADLAGLVCDQHGNDQCINPLRGTDHNGDTWEKRRETIDKLSSELNTDEN